MTKKKAAEFRLPTADEQEILAHLDVELVEPEERGRCDQFIVQEHYLHSAQLVGEHLRYVANYRGQWLAVATWSAPALHLKARDQFIGWTEEQRRKRLALVVNNARLLVLPGGQCPNLISRFMKRMLTRLRTPLPFPLCAFASLRETFRFGGPSLPCCLVPEKPR